MRRPRSAQPANPPPASADPPTLASGAVADGAATTAAAVPGLMPPLQATMRWWVDDDAETSAPSYAAHAALLLAGGKGKGEPVAQSLAEDVSWMQRPRGQAAVRRYPKVVAAMCRCVFGSGYVIPSIVLPVCEGERAAALEAAVLPLRLALAAPQLRGAVHHLDLSYLGDAVTDALLSQVAVAWGSSLRVLSLGDSKNLHAAAVCASLRRCTGLTTLHIERAVDAGIAYLEGLAMPTPAPLCGTLKQLHTSGWVNDECLLWVAAHLPALEGLSLIRGGISEDVMASVLQLRNLQYLNAQSCPNVTAICTAPLPPNFTHAPPLRTLGLGDTEFGDTAMPALVERFPSIERLFLAGFAGTKRSAHAFHRLTLCRCITVNGALVDEEVARAVIGGMPCLQEANFSHWGNLGFSPLVFGFDYNSRTGALTPQRVARRNARGRRGTVGGGEDGAVDGIVARTGIVDGVDLGGAVVSRSLRVLRVASCSNIMELSLAVIVAVCPELRVLDVSDCRYLGPHAAAQLFEGEGSTRTWRLWRLRELHTRPQGAHLGDNQRKFVERVLRLASQQSPVAIYDQ